MVAIEMKYVMLSATGHFFIIEQFGYTWTFQDYPGLGYWNSLTKMKQFYKTALGMTDLGEL